MENNFDKYFKDKLEHREFEMKPEYWQGAEALIEKADRDNRRKGIFFWFGLVILFSIIGILAWNNFSDKNKIAKEEMDNSISKTEMNLNPSTDLNEKNTEVASGILSETKNDNATVNAITKNQNQILNQNNNSSKDENKLTQSFQKIENNNQKKYYDANTNTFDNISNQIINSEPIQTTIPKSENNIGSNISNNQKLNSSIPIKVEATSDSRSEIKADASSKKTDKEKVIEEPIALDVILILSLNLFLEEQKFDFDVSGTKVLCPYQEDPNFTFGAIGGAVGYPLIKNISSTPFIGLKGGLFTEYRFDDTSKMKNWSIALEALYHYRRGNFINTEESETLTYSFGRSVAVETVTPTGLHYLEIPLMLKYDFGKSKIGFGSSFNYLIGVQGKVNKIDETLTGLIPNVGFKKSHVNVLLDFHYEIPKTKGSMFGARLNYTLGGILSGEKLQDTGPLAITFRFVQYLRQ